MDPHGKVEIVPLVCFEVVLGSTHLVDYALHIATSTFLTIGTTMLVSVWRGH
jgi:hypothetical protein